MTIRKYLVTYSAGEIDTEVHYDSPIQGGGDTALCGFDLAGDSRPDYSYDAAQETNKRVTCPDCIAIMQFCNRKRKGKK